MHGVVVLGGIDCGVIARVTANDVMYSLLT